MPLDPEQTPTIDQTSRSIAPAQLPRRTASPESPPKNVNLAERLQATIVARWQRALGELLTVSDQPGGLRNGTDIVRFLDEATFQKETAPALSKSFALTQGREIVLNGRPMQGMWDASKRAFPQLNEDERCDLISQLTLHIYAHELQHQYDSRMVSTIVGRQFHAGRLLEHELSAQYTNHLVVLEQSLSKNGGAYLPTLGALALNGSELAEQLYRMHERVSRGTSDQSPDFLRSAVPNPSLPDGSLRYVELGANRESGPGVVATLTRYHHDQLERVIPETRRSVAQQGRIVEEVKRELSSLAQGTREAIEREVQSFEVESQDALKTADLTEKTLRESLESIETLKDPKVFGSVIDYYQGRLEQFQAKRRKLLRN